MLRLDELKQTKYQEALEEGGEQRELQAKLGLVAKLLNRGLSIEEVAELLDLEVEQVRQAAKQ